MRTWLSIVALAAMVVGILGCQGSMSAKSASDRNGSTLGDTGVHASGALQVGGTSVVR